MSFADHEPVENEPPGPRPAGNRLVDDEGTTDGRLGDERSDGRPGDERPGGRLGDERSDGRLGDEQKTNGRLGGRHAAGGPVEGDYSGDGLFKDDRSVEGRHSAADRVDEERSIEAAAAGDESGENPADADADADAAGGDVAGKARETLWRTAGGWRGVSLALGIFVLTRVGQLGMLYWIGHSAGRNDTVRSKLLVWDAGWFIRVATKGYPHGYTYDQSNVLQGNELAFFPLYPKLIRLGVRMGLDSGTAAIGVSWIVSIGLAIALYLLGTELYNKRVGWALVAICCSAPMSVVFSLAYSEGIFLALVAAMLVAARRRSWWLAGVLGMAAALSRPTGAAAAVALAVAALLELRRIRRERDRESSIWPPIVATAIALAGGPAYIVWVAFRVGEPTAWFKIQNAGWGSSFDYGLNTLKFLEESFTKADGWIPMSTALLLVVALIAAVVALVQKPWLPVAVYGLVGLVLVYGQAGYYHSKPRLLVPVLLTLLPAAIAAGRARWWVATLSITAWAAFGLWYGAYFVGVWPYTI